jgi:uncharacterized membrane protein YphA (DoxX/SURF4 family)
MTNKQSGQDIGLFALRISVGLYMLLAGIGKVQGEINNGIGSFSNGPFTAMKPDWLPSVMAMPYGYALPWLEVLVGATLIVGFYTRLTGLVGMGMLASFTIALILKFDSITAQPDGPGGPFNANYIQCTAYLLFALLGAGRWSVDAAMSKRKKS